MRQMLLFSYLGSANCCVLSQTYSTAPIQLEASYMLHGQQRYKKDMQERQRAVTEGPEEGHKGDQMAAAPPL